jgi:hypothetical protein
VILVALAIFQTWIRVGVGIAKLLIDLGFRNFFGTKIIWSGACYLLVGWLFGYITLMD